MTEQAQSKAGAMHASRRLFVFTAVHVVCFPSERLWHRSGRFLEGHLQEFVLTRAPEDGGRKPRLPS